MLDSMLAYELTRPLPPRVGFLQSVQATLETASAAQGAKYMYALYLLPFYLNGRLRLIKPQTPDFQ
jgi:hypothetical protein